MVDKNTCRCFYCEKKFDKNTSYTLRVDTFEGLIEYDACPDCAKEFDAILKNIEEVKNEI